MKKINSTTTFSLSFSQILLYCTPVLLALITFITYFPSLFYAFQFDDEPSILKFYNIRNQTFSDLFFTSTRWVSYWLNTIHYKLGMFAPFVYRRSNVIFHCITGMLVYIVILLLMRLLPKNSFCNKYAYWIASITSALFLLHPVQTQTVSYVIQGQLEGLSALFSLLIILSFIFLVTQAKHLPTKITFLGTTLALCLISCGTKEITIVLPFLLPLIDWFFIAQGNWEKLKNNLWIHALVALTIWSCYLWLLGKNFFIYVFSLSIEHTNTIGNVLTEYAGQKITAGPFFISQFKVILHYLFMFTWPFSISIDYDWKLCRGITSPDCIIPFVILVGLFALILWSLKKNHTNACAFGMLWFFICMAPRSTIMPSTELMADYKTYLASVGWLLVLALALVYGYHAFKPMLLRNKFVIAGLCALGLGLLSFATYERNKVWHSGVAFWEDIIKKAPHKARGYNNYGVNLLSEQNDVQKAIWAFKRAIQLEPTTYPDPYNNISAAFALTNRLDLAVQALRASLHINPYQHKAYNNIGIYLMQKNFDDLAEKAFKQAIMIYPHYGKAYFNLGRLYLKQKRMNDAWQSFKNACTVADYDNHAECITAYAQTSMNLKKFEEVINAYELLAKVQKLNPDDILSLADAHAMLEQYDQAEPRYIQVLDCQDCAVHANHNLCELYCRQRNYSQALATIMHLEQQHLSYPDLPIRKAECLYHTGNRTQARALLQEFTKITRNFNLRVAAQRLLSKMN
jgi:tetratricopeptide (TPR) repeat protein